MIWAAALVLLEADMRRSICPTGPPNRLPTPESSSSNIITDAPSVPNSPTITRALRIKTPAMALTRYADLHDQQLPISSNLHLMHKPSTWSCAVS